MKRKVSTSGSCKPGGPVIDNQLKNRLGPLSETRFKAQKRLPGRERFLVPRVASEAMVAGNGGGLRSGARLVCSKQVVHGHQFQARQIGRARYRANATRRFQAWRQGLDWARATSKKHTEEARPRKRFECIR